jgi:hypothetical protein
MNLETSVQLCKNQTKFHMATSKVLSIALFVLLGLSMCSATRKLYDNRDSEDFGRFDGFQPQGYHLPVPQTTGSGGLLGGLPGVPGEEGLGDGGLPGGIGSGALPGGLRGVPDEGDLGDEKVLGGLPGEYPGGVNSGGDGYQPVGAEVPGEGGDGGLPGTGPVEGGLEDGVLPDERGVLPDEKGYV